MALHASRPRVLPDKLTTSSPLAVFNCLTYSATSAAVSSFNFCPAIENSGSKTVVGEGAEAVVAAAEEEAEEFEFPIEVRYLWWPLVGWLWVNI